MCALLLEARASGAVPCEGARRSMAFSFACAGAPAAGPRDLQLRTR